MSEPMTTPPRLAPAPLLTMTDNHLEWMLIEQSAGAALGQVLAELEAQRLARARERRAALEEAIAVVKAQGDVEVILAHMLTQCHGDQAYDLAVGHCASALEALRDREEA